MASLLRVLLILAAVAAGAWHATGSCLAEELLDESVPEATETTEPNEVIEATPGDWIGRTEEQPPAMPANQYGGSWSPIPNDPYSATDTKMEPPLQPRLRFVQVDLAVVKPHFNRGFSTGRNAEMTANPPVLVPFASMATTVMPRFEIGMSTAEGGGEYHLAYQFLHSQGSEPMAGLDELGGGTLRSMIDAHLADLDYVFSETAIGAIADYPQPMVPKFRWTAGARFGAVYFESEAQGKAILQLAGSQKFFGAGPRLGLELIWPAYIPSLTVFGKAVGSIVVGASKQEFVRTVGPGTSAPDTYGLSHEMNTVPMINAQFGFHWVPEACNQRARFTCGYQYERWISLGTRTVTNIDVILGGFFCRGEYAF